MKVPEEMIRTMMFESYKKWGHVLSEDQLDHLFVALVADYKLSKEKELKNGKRSRT